MLKIALAQINPTVGDLSKNVAKILEFADQETSADLIIYPELCLTGYSPEDLLLSANFMDKVSQYTELLINKAPANKTLVVGLPTINNNKTYNSLIVIQNNKLIAQYNKQKLPNYGVFDEHRYFTADNTAVYIDIKGIKCSLNICEDIWHDNIIDNQNITELDLIIAINASPYQQNKNQLRQDILGKKIKKIGVPLVYVNQVGGQDELIFDGSSFVLNSYGERVLALGNFVEDYAVISYDQINTKPIIIVKEDSVADIYAALVASTRDYIHKNGFTEVVLGLSGGIDSALVLCIAVDALGANQVTALLMPSRYNSDISLEDAIKQAKTLNVKYEVISIEPMFKSFLADVDFLTNQSPDITEENIQARIRGIILMAKTNKTGSMLLTTGNKSEMSVGYATLYGDMAGGFAPIKDVYKTLVFKLAKYCNASQEIIPLRVIERPPTAELADKQQDSDSLPSYDVLDYILDQYIENQSSAEQINVKINDLKLVNRIINLVNISEYKRRQSPPGVKITSCSYGKERRLPITNGFKLF